MFALTPDLTARLRALSQREGVTVFMTLLAAFKVLLHRYTGQDDIVLGVPVANRNRAELEGLVGFFVNTLVMRTSLADDPDFREVLRRVRKVALGAYAHEDLPFERLVEELHPERDLSRNPLFQVTFQLFSAPPTEDSLVTEFGPQALVVEKGTSNVDLAFDLFEAGSIIGGPVEYSVDLFEPGTVARMLEHYRNVLEAVVSDPDRRISGLPVLGEEERRHMLVEWNATRAEYPNECIHTLVEAQAERTPEQVALEFESERVTYGELNRAANRIANHLRSLGAGPGVMVALCLERSAQLIPALLGILKAGAAYVPLDPAYPRERLAFLLEDSGAALLVTDTALLSRLPSTGARAICLDADRAAIERMPDTAPASGVTPADPAYTIYTSGSTGRPKGVMVSHRALVNHMWWLQSTFPMTAADAMPLKYSLSFDVAAVEMFAPLMAGARVVVARPGGHLDAAYLARLIATRGITAIDVVPSTLAMLLDEPEFARCRGLRRISCGGEALSLELVERCLDTLNVELVNMYGPTETAITATYHVCSRGAARATAPIGRPIANMRAYVLDARGNPVPIGVEGELHLAGDGLAIGYRNSPELTARRFVPDPFEPGGRMYRTGDLARYLPDGSLEFAGRIDEQVKMRGFRIEPGEIESALAQHPGVETASVIGFDDLKSGATRLAAYFVPKNSEPEFWPSVGEYFIYDELLYYAMTHDERRNRAYRRAIERVVPGKTVVDPGTGADALLARMCVECGAAKVYAIEMLDDAYEKARAGVERLGLAGKITVLHGDATRIELPERVDVCVSEVIGTIASSEGAAVLLDKVRRFLKPGGVMIPLRAATRIAAARLPDAIGRNPAFSELSGPYAGKIFEKTGGPFDVRLCVKNFPAANLLSPAATFEKLDFTRALATDYSTEIDLPIETGGRLDGFLLWLNLFVSEYDLIDTFALPYSWLPVFFPVFDPGLEVRRGDAIHAVCSTALNSNGFTPDYRIQGTLRRKSGAVVEFDYALYQRLWDGDWQRRFVPQRRAASGADLRKHLQRWLPDYMIPSVFVPLTAMPLTHSGKLDRQALPLPGRDRPELEHAFTAPRTRLEKMIAVIWRDLLNLDMVGTGDSFFELGGHSLLLVRVASRLREALNEEISIVDLFRFPTIGALAVFLGGKSREPDSLQTAHSRAEKQRKAIGQLRTQTKERTVTP
jgi:amino acid adenylation domain-containing protein